MTRRALVLILAGLLAIGLVTPGLGGSDGGGLELATIAKKAFKKTRARAKRANQRLDALEVASASADGLVTTTAAIGTYAALGGPSVTVTVPDSGLIEVWAQAQILSDDGGTVALFEDGAKVPGVSEPDFCGDNSALIEMEGGGPADFDTFSTPPSLSFIGCTNIGAPAPVLLQRSPGTHTFELRYSVCQCPGAGEAEFRNRVLRVAARP